jgi:hypothetical protein
MSLGPYDFASLVVGFVAGILATFPVALTIGQRALSASPAQQIGARR